VLGIMRLLAFAVPAAVDRDQPVTSARKRLVPVRIAPSDDPIGAEPVDQHNRRQAAQHGGVPSGRVRTFGLRLDEIIGDIDPVCGRNIGCHAGYLARLRISSKTYGVPMERNVSPWLLVGAVNGFIGVAAGAFAAHGLEARVDARSLEIFSTAANYQL